MAARDYLASNREEVKKSLSRVRPEVKRARTGALAIAEYTGFSKTTVEISLIRLKAIESGEVDKEALYKMPNTEAAKRFMKMVAMHPHSKPHQKRIAERIVEEDRYGEPSIAQAFLEFIPLHEKSDLRYPGFFARQLAKAMRQGNGLIRTLSEFDRLNPDTITGGEASAEDIPEEIKERFSIMGDRLGEMMMMVGKKLDEKPKPGWFAES